MRAKYLIFLFALAGSACLSKNIPARYVPAVSRAAENTQDIENVTARKAPSVLFMTTARYMHTATLLPNGKVLIAGGRSSGGQAVSSAELYDPAAGTFSITGPMSAARAYHTATLLPNGKVLIIGGFTSDSAVVLSSAELYDPVTGTFTDTAEMSVTRNAHVAVLLRNGKVLVAGGGLDNVTATLSSAELYDPSTLTTHIFKTAQVFNQFYGSSPVLKAEPKVARARLVLVESTANVLQNGLRLLGMETLEEM